MSTNSSFDQLKMKFPLLLLLIVAAALTSFSAVVDARQWKLHRLSSSEYPLATCLDGTQGAYYVRPGSDGNSRKVLVHFQGGGFCAAIGKDPSFETKCNHRNCKERAKMKRGSTKNDATFKFEREKGLLSTSSAINPAFWDWTHVYVRYCDGQAFLGRRRDPVRAQNGQTLYIRGNYILEALIKDMSHRSYGALKGATHVVLEGSSVGGLTAILHAHRFKKALPPSVRMAAVSDGGFFVEWPPLKKKCPKTSIVSVYRSIYSLANAADSLSQQCIDDQPTVRAHFKCMFAARALPYVPIPGKSISELF